MKPKIVLIIFILNWELIFLARLHIKGILGKIEDLKFVIIFPVSYKIDNLSESLRINF